MTQANNLSTKKIDFRQLSPRQILGHGGDGAVIHIVQSGQTLAGIATVYGVPLEEILSLNDLQLESIIQPGDQVVVFAPSPTPTFTAIASATARRTHTPPASPTPSPTEARISTSTPPPVPAQDGGINAVDFLLFSLVIFAIALVIVILSSSRSYPKNDTKSGPTLKHFQAQRFDRAA